MKAMTRRSQTAAANRASSSAAKPTITAPVRASDAVASSAVGPNFDDEENVIMSFLIALHESILANTAAAGPAKESKDAVWGLICGRLRNKIGGIERTDEQVRARWRSMRSGFHFKSEKIRRIAELFFKKIKGTQHRVRLSDITVNKIKFPQWMTALIKSDDLLNANSQEKEVVSTSSKPQSKRTSPADKDDEDVPPRKKGSARSGGRLSTIPTLVPQFPPSELSTLRMRAVKQERVAASSDSASPNSGIGEELNSVTESGTNSRPSSILWEETEYESRRRREEEYHQAKLALLRSQKQEADAKTQLTKLQIEAFLRESGSISSLLPSVGEHYTATEETVAESTVPDTPPQLQADGESA